MAKYWITKSYNLQNLKQFNLRFSDIIFLDWFDSFSKSGTMVERKFLNPYTGNVEKYYWVCYQGVLDDLRDLISVTSRKSIAREFQKFVDYNLMYKHVLKNLSGSYTYFRLNEKTFPTLLDNTSFFKATEKD